MLSKFRIKLGDSNSVIHAALRLYRPIENLRGLSHWNVDIFALPSFAEPFTNNWHQTRNSLSFWYDSSPSLHVLSESEPISIPRLHVLDCRLKLNTLHTGFLEHSVSHVMNFGVEIIPIVLLEARQY